MAKRGPTILTMVALFTLINAAVNADNVLIRPWGANALRVQIAPPQWKLTDDLATAYLPGGAPKRAREATSADANLDDGWFSYGSADGGDGSTQVTSGNIKAEADATTGLIIITRVSDGKVLLSESERNWPVGPTGSFSSSSLTFDFSSSSTKLYGLGQNRHANNGPGLGLNVINESYSFADSIGEEGGPSNSLPWVLGANPSAGGFQFGILHNSPSLGGVAFSETNGTMAWSIVADAGMQTLRQQYDFLITTHAASAKNEEKPFQIVESYVDAVGHARKMPWTGYWHSKNRYASQDELLAVARGFHNRSIPVDVIVIDWFHWKIMGDWSFDESKWPDPKAMVDECKSYGMEIMVSVWPFTCPKSRSYDTLTDPKNNWVTTYVSDDGKRTLLPIETHGKSCRLVDASNPDFRKYAWSLIESGYYQYGIRIFWLDASEPEGFGTQALNASWSVGNMRDQGSMFQLYWSQTFYDGLRSHGETDIMMLPRAGWVGTWRHGAVLWSGDIGSTMPVLKSQLNIGLSAQMSGVPWWTTDVGGYHGGNAEDPTYRETIVRWFQYGMTCPIFRQHGARDHTAIWFYGAEDEQILGDIIKLRASMKPYFKAQLDMLNATGRPFNRPLMWDFPDDPRTWELAERGIGDNGSSAANTSYLPAMAKNGDFVLVAPCLAPTAAAAWTQQWTMKGSDIVLTKKDTLCVDDGGNTHSSPPTGPFPIHLWTATRKWSASQSWSYDGTAKQFTNTNSMACLSTGGNTTHPVVTKCDPSDVDQQWVFDATSTSGGTIVTTSGMCLTAAKQQDTPSGGGVGVADQYMMGDDFMVAPILNLGQRKREIYFPGTSATTWTHHYTGTTYSGGSTAMVDAPLNEFPLFKRS